eukprot:TRINITY_DN1246_c0_g1_i4.p1 TRINITY_DN1246_c0_g1~~TRINITY_DN1246_c0_g1_i4.p1  ORF type:complete len:283 (+),score=-41.13 TRINITY_DN1246_c0_g1_i4:439-1287(+)
MIALNQSHHKSLSTLQHLTDQQVLQQINLIIIYLVTMDIIIIIIMNKTKNQQKLTGNQNIVLVIIFFTIMNKNKNAHFKRTKTMSQAQYTSRHHQCQCLIKTSQNQQKLTRNQNIILSCYNIFYNNEQNQKCSLQKNKNNVLSIIYIKTPLVLVFNQNEPKLTKTSHHHISCNRGYYYYYYYEQNQKLTKTYWKPIFCTLLLQYFLQNIIQQQYIILYQYNNEQILSQNTLQLLIFIQSIIPYRIKLFYRSVTIIHTLNKFLYCIHQINFFIQTQHKFLHTV